MTFRWCLAFLACLILAVPTSSSVVHLLAAPGPLRIHAVYKAGFAPKKVSVDIHIVPEADDRWIWIKVFEGGLVADSGEIQLHRGEESQRTHHWPFTARWPGDYTIVVQLGNALKVRATASERLSTL